MTAKHPSVGDFLRGRTLLLTGGTGFLGKVVVERLLRTAPEVERIYLLIRPSRLTPPERFEAEVVRSRAFDTLAAMHGDRWLRLIRDTVVPVAGDVSQPRLGMDDETHAALTQSVDIVINSAASVAFDAPLDEALRHNTRSVQHGVEFARACRSAALVQVSTAYVAGQRTGRIPETALTPDISAREMAAVEASVAATLEEARAQGVAPRELRAQLVALGMQRARELGWHDSYTYTKALGEMTLERSRGDVPTAIIRPTIIESSLRDPAPGWIENLNVGDPIFIEFGRGRMPDFPLGRDAVFDIVPVDLVANAVLAVLPHVGDLRQRAGYYAVGTSSTNPLSGARLYDLTYEYFLRDPMVDRDGRPIPPPRWTFPSPEEFRATVAGRVGREADVKRLLHLAHLYGTYTNAACIFDTTNTQQLLASLAAADRDTLDFDVRRVDWRSYLQDVHLPGLRRHILRDDQRRRAYTRD
ncbi:MAG: SDR family oxidoreductase [Acidobacteriota bacterium]|nr:SDR family oxidoreductase [Acidobacteriota bacterium]